MRKTSSSIRQQTVRILCALALLFAGFGAESSASGVGELTPAELAQYRLPDGTLPILCITYKDDDGKVHGKVHVPTCDACQMAVAVVIPAAPVADDGHLPFVVAKFIAPKSVSFHRQLYPPNSGPRAPPFPSIIA